MIENAIVIANVFGGPLPPTTQNWLAENFPVGRALHFCKQVPQNIARNSMIRDVALPFIAREKLDWIWFIDHDVTLTHPGLDRWLSIEGDVVSCDCAMRTGEAAWGAEDAFHDHFWRCRPEVLLALDPPWFCDNVSSDGCDLLGCECGPFAARVRAAGFTIRHGGYCGHAMAGTWMHT